jgi:hypothetical protein
MKQFVFAVVFGALVVPAFGQNVTVCQGTASCTVVYGNSARQMTPEELDRKNKSDARTAAGNVNCYVSSDPVRCRELVLELHELLR